MKKNYLPIAHALQECVQRAMSFSLVKEDPYGNRKAHRISGIRLLYLDQEQETYSFINGIRQPKKKAISEPQLLITLFYQGEKKHISKSLAIEEALLTEPDGLRMCFLRILAYSINGLFDEFYSSSVADNKKHQEKEEEILTCPDESFTLEEMQTLPPDLLNQLQSLAQKSYLTEVVSDYQLSVAVRRKTWIIVDQRGTQVINPQETIALLTAANLLNRKKEEVPVTISKMYTNIDKLEADLPLIKQAMQEHISSRDRSILKSEIYPLIFAPSATGTLFHEALAAHMLSGRYILDGTSTVFKDKTRKQIAKQGFMEVLKKLEIWDDPTDTEMVANYRFDMEGSPSQKTCLIDKGQLVSYLLDKNSAFQLKLPNNAHALAGTLMEQGISAFGSLITTVVTPEPRISNLKILSKTTDTLEDLKNHYLQTYGYYLWVESHAGEVQVETGTFEISVECIKKVDAKGTVTYYHGGVFSANLIDFLSAIHTVTNKYGHTQGSCGAGSGWIPTSELAPAIGVYGVNWIPNPAPEKEKLIDLKRDKYIPKEWKESQNKFEI